MQSRSSNYSARILALALCLAFICTLALASEFTGKVVGVSDGDTIKVLKDGLEVKIRFNGIELPGEEAGIRTKGQGLHRREGRREDRDDMGKDHR